MKVACGCPLLHAGPEKYRPGTVSDEVTTAMDLLPTVLKQAGGKIPVDRVIDGYDIWPILSGKANAKSPYKAFYYYFLGQLQAVRSGKWKLYLPLKEKWDRRRWRNEKGDPSELKLVDLDADIGENHNLAAAHPDVVRLLMSYADKARKDLGDIGKPGSGQRPAGHYPNPRPLWLNRVKRVPE